MSPYSSTLWAAIRGFFITLVLGCFFCVDENKTTSAGFAHHFPEGDGYLYVANLGSGIQGTAVLVRSVSDQQLYVRKRRKFWSDRFPAANEAKFALEHENIPRYVRQTEYCGLNQDNLPSTTTADIWTYCNGGDMQRVLGLARDMSTQVPAVLIWRLLSQLLAATLHLHHGGVIHRDIKASNVFLHWKAADASLPDFFLGDFGIACRRSGRANGTGAHTFDFRSVLNLAKLAINPRAVSLGTVPAPSGREGESAAALFRVFEKFDRALLNFGTSGNKNDFVQSMSELQKEVKEEGNCWEKEVREGSLREYKLETGEEVEVFKSEETLLLAPKPPGPWQIAGVELRGSEWLVTRVLDRTYCKDDAMYT